VTDQELRARLFERIAETPSPARADVWRRTAFTVSSGAALSLLGFFLVGIVYLRHGLTGPVWDADQRDPTLVAATFGGAAVIATAALWTAFGRGGSMLGRGAEALGAVVLASPAAFFLWKWGWSSAYGSTAWWDDRLGLKCMDLSLISSGFLLVSLIAARRGSDPLYPGATGAALGVAAGTVGAVLLELWCPVGHPAHLLLGHVLPMIAYGAIGYVAGRRWLPYRRG
jgi:hypothetical protein